MAKVLLLFCALNQPPADCHKDTAMSWQAIPASPLACAMAGETTAAAHPDADEGGYRIKVECPRQ